MRSPRGLRGARASVSDASSSSLFGDSESVNLCPGLDRIVNHTHNLFIRSERG